MFNALRTDELLVGIGRVLRIVAKAPGALEEYERSQTCASCEEELAPSDENWRDGATLHEAPIADRFASLGMLVRDRTESPRVTMREYFCPACASSLGVDVATEGLEVMPAATALKEVAGVS